MPINRHFSPKWKYFWNSSSISGRIYRVQTICCFVLHSVWMMTSGLKPWLEGLSFLYLVIFETFMVKLGMKFRKNSKKKFFSSYSQINDQITIPYHNVLTFFNMWTCLGKIVPTRHKIKVFIFFVFLLFQK